MVVQQSVNESKQTTLSYLDETSTEVLTITDIPPEPTAHPQDDWTLQEKVHSLFDITSDYPNKTYERISHIESIIMFTLVLASIALFCVETLPVYVRNDEAAKTFFLLEAIVVGFFTIEFLIRATTSPSKLRFFKSWLTIFDLLSIIPFYVEIIYRELASQDGEESNSSSQFSGAQIFRLLRLTRVFRAFKLTKYSVGLQVVGQTMATSGPPLLLLTFLLLIVILICATSVFLLEGQHATLDRDRKKWIYNDGTVSPFQSIPDSFWWGVVTITTVGYGDNVPREDASRLVAAIAMLVGMLSITFPTFAITENFAIAYGKYRTAIQESNLESYKPKVTRITKPVTLKQKIFSLFTPEGPHSTRTWKKASYGVTLLTVICIAAAVISFLLQSDPKVYYEGSKTAPTLEAVDLVTAVAFTIEWVVRMVTYPKFKKFWLQTNTWIDFLAFFPYWVETLIINNVANESDGERLQGLLVLRTIRMTRVFRMLKISKYNRNLNVVMYTLSSSKESMLLLLFVLFLLLVFFGASIYLAELTESEWIADSKEWRRNDGSWNPYQSVPHSFWWVIVTITTVGYGVEVPVTVLGKCLAALCMLAGLVTIAFPLILLGANYSRALEYYGKSVELPDPADLKPSVEVVTYFCYGEALRKIYSHGDDVASPLEIYMFENTQSPSGGLADWELRAGDIMGIPSAYRDNPLTNTNSSNSFCPLDVLSAPVPEEEALSRLGRAIKGTPFPHSLALDNIPLPINVSPVSAAAGDGGASGGDGSTGEDRGLGPPPSPPTTFDDHIPLPIQPCEHDEVDNFSDHEEQRTAYLSPLPIMLNSEDDQAVMEEEEPFPRQSSFRTAQESVGTSLHTTSFRTTSLRTTLTLDEDAIREAQEEQLTDFSQISRNSRSDAVDGPIGTTPPRHTPEFTRSASSVLLQQRANRLQQAGPSEWQFRYEPLYVWAVDACTRQIKYSITERDTSPFWRLTLGIVLDTPSCRRAAVRALMRSYCGLPIGACNVYSRTLCHISVHALSVVEQGFIPDCKVSVPLQTKDRQTKLPVRFTFDSRESVKWFLGHLFHTRLTATVTYGVHKTPYVIALPALRKTTLYKVLNAIDVRAPTVYVHPHHLRLLCYGTWAQLVLPDGYGVITSPKQIDEKIYQHFSSTNELLSTHNFSFEQWQQSHRGQELLHSKLTKLLNESFKRGKNGKWNTTPYLHLNGNHIVNIDLFPLYDNVTPTTSSWTDDDLVSLLQVAHLSVVIENDTIVTKNLWLLEFSKEAFGRPDSAIRLELVQREPSLTMDVDIKMPTVLHADDDDSDSEYLMESESDEDICVMRYDGSKDVLAEPTTVQPDSPYSKP